MKLFVLAVQCAGKTTLAQYLRGTTEYKVVEMDDEILRLNGGSWPTDFQYKITQLEPAIYTRVMAMQDVIFMNNHLTIEHAAEFKQAGFSIVLIKVARDDLLQRNKERVASGDQDDASQWIDLELQNATELDDSNLIDKVIDGLQSTENIATELLAYAQHKEKT